MLIASADHRSAVSFDGLMRILHAAVSKVFIPGIAQQMLSEQRAANAIGIPWSVRYYASEFGAGAQMTPEESDLAVPVLMAEAGTSYSWVGLRRRFFRSILSVEDDFDALLLRYSMYDPIQYCFLRKLKKPVFLLHHTLEVPELSLESSGSGKLKASLEAIIGPYSLRLASGIVGVTREILDYECRRIGLDDVDGVGYVYPNGYSYDDSMLAADCRTGSPSLLFVASDFAPWHGLDLVFESVQSCQESFRLDIVGDVSAEDRAQVRNDGRVRFHGRLALDEIRSLANHTDVGIASFALYRKNMREACTLKVREYLAMGLPVYAGYRDVFSEAFPYFKQGRPSMDDILSYAREARMVPRRAVADAARAYVDKKALLRAIYDWLVETTSGRLHREIIG